MMHRLALLAVALFLTLSSPAAAYVGPGAGLSLLGAVWALLAAVAAALVFLIAWPLRRMRRRRLERHADVAREADAAASDMASASPTAGQPSRQ